MLLLARLEDGINLAHASGNAEQSLKHGARDREEPPMPDLADLFPGYEAKWINTSQGRIFARVGGKYTAKRYYTYLNDGGVPSFWLANLSAGYKLKNLGFVKDLSLQVNVTNLFDKQYISSIGTNGFQASDPKGTAQTLLTGAPRQLFITLNGKL